MGHTRIRHACAHDAPEIADIYNQAIEARSATFETTPRSAADIVRRLAGHHRHPILVAIDDVRLLGWGSIGDYRPRECYAGVGEFSVYVDRMARGQGIGKQLLEALVREAAALGYWKLLSRVFTCNTASLAMCRSCGFREVGTYERHARLDGRWLDVVIVERLIPENQPEGPEGEAR